LAAEDTKKLLDRLTKQHTLLAKRAEKVLELVLSKQNFKLSSAEAQFNRDLLQIKQQKIPELQENIKQVSCTCALMTRIAEHTNGTTEER
jgi:hypothetical protein